MRLKTYLLAFLAILPLPGLNLARGNVRLSPLISSNMVLQRDVPGKIIGWADVGEKVVIAMGAQTVGNAVGAGPEKSWTVALPVLKAGPVPDITVTGNNTVKLTNLLAGDVWVCSGQSNMEMSLKVGRRCPYGGVANADAEVAAALYPQIRLLVSTSNQPWAECSPESAQTFSATGYFFGRELARGLNIPIGLIQAAEGGTMAEMWTPLSTREKWAGYQAAQEKAQRTIAETKPIVDSDELAGKEWKKTVEELKGTGKELPPRPVWNWGARIAFQTATMITKTGSLYTRKIAPLTAMPIKGVIWYQGESNAIQASEYTELMSQLIAGWRQAWGQGSLPFLLVQLANYDYPETQAFLKGTWPALRAAQKRVAESMSGTGMAVSIDIGDAKNIHPKNKQEVGRRLALVALKQAYGRDVIAGGPEPTDVQFGSAKVTVVFNPGGKEQQLVVKPATDSGFEVAGADGQFVSAAVEVKGNTLAIVADAVPQPVAVRYAWKDNPAATLFNSAGLPSAPFALTKK